MNVELMKRMMDACYLAQRVRGMLPPLPAGVTPAYIHYLDIIEMLEKQGVRAKISDISDALDLPRPGVTRTVKAMEAKGYLKKIPLPKTVVSLIFLSQKPGGSCPVSTTNSFSPLSPLLWKISRKKI
mgnify:CR=1 FL=1